MMAKFKRRKTQFHDRLMIIAYALGAGNNVNKDNREITISNRDIKLIAQEAKVAPDQVEKYIQVYEKSGVNGLMHMHGRYITEEHLTPSDEEQAITFLDEVKKEYEQITSMRVEHALFNNMLKQ